MSEWQRILARGTETLKCCQDRRFLLLILNGLLFHECLMWIPGMESPLPCTCVWHIQLPLVLDTSYQVWQLKALGLQDLLASHDIRNDISKPPWLGSLYLPGPVGLQYRLPHISRHGHCSRPMAYGPELKNTCCDLWGLPWELCISSSSGFSLGLQKLSWLCAILLFKFTCFFIHRDFWEGIIHTLLYHEARATAKQDGSADPSAKDDDMWEGWTEWNPDTLFQQWQVFWWLHLNSPVSDPASLRSLEAAPPGRPPAQTTSHVNQRVYSNPQ